MMSLGTRWWYSNNMKPINWNANKNRQLLEERNISFEDIIYSLMSGGLLDDLSHPNKSKYANQRLLVVSIEDYVWIVPYVETTDEIFLKTIIPSRKATKKYLGEPNEKH